MAVTMKYTHTINNHVVESTKYGSAKVGVTLDEATRVVEAYPADVYDVKVAGKPSILLKTCATLAEARAFYSVIVNELMQGDVIRTVG